MWIDATYDVPTLDSTYTVLVLSKLKKINATATQRFKVFCNI